MRKAVLAATILLGGCWEDQRRQQSQQPQTPPAQVQAQSGQANEARRAAEERVRTRLRIVGDMRLRGVQVYPQAIAGTMAVCGQINPTGRMEEPFIPFVVAVSFDGDRVGRADLTIGTSNIEASRVFVEWLDRCWEGGGPATARATIRPMPPLPTELPRAAVAQAEPPAQAPQPVQQPQQATASIGTVMTSSRTPVNIRANPQSGSDILRVAPRSTTLQVFGQAPGGWLQVGENEPWGWMHSSLAEGR